MVIEMAATMKTGIRVERIPDAELEPVRAEPAPFCRGRRICVAMTVWCRGLKADD